MDLNDVPLFFNRKNLLVDRVPDTFWGLLGFWAENSK